MRMHNNNDGANIQYAILVDDAYKFVTALFMFPGNIQGYPRWGSGA